MQVLKILIQESYNSHKILVWHTSSEHQIHAMLVRMALAMVIGN